MEFTFSPEQDALRSAVRATLTNEAGPAYVRRMVDDDERGVDESLWRTFADLGWLGVLVPPSCGGLGLGLVDLVVVQEEMGRLPMPGPYLSSAVLATLAARALDRESPLLADLASGTRRGTVAVEEWGSGDPLASVATTATRAGDGWVLDGLKPVVLDAHVADWAIVVARDTSSDGLAGFLVESPPSIASVVPALDVTRKTCRLELDGVPARRLGPDGDQRELWQRVLDDASVALCAETLGACEAAYAMAVEYATQRVQFDRPIGSFQVIRHKLVDMLHALTLAQVGVHWAAWTSDVDDAERAHAAAMAKAFVGDASVFVTAENIQVHGGVGFTWDVDAHLYYRRVKQNDVLLGPAGWQRRRLADLVLGQEAGPTSRVAAEAGH